MERVRASRARPRAIPAVLTGLAILVSAGLWLLADAGRGRGARADVAVAHASLAAEVPLAPAARIVLASPREAETRTTLEVPPRSRSDVAVAASDRAAARPPGSPQGRLSGRVTETGLPLAGALLRLRAVQPDELAPRADLETRTDGAGRYRLERVPAGAYRLQVFHHTRASAFETALEVRAGEDAFDVDLQLAVIEGRVLDPHGAPLASIRVQARRAQETETQGAGGVFTAADGRYVLRGVPCDVELVVEASSRGRQLQASEIMRLAANEVRSGVDLTLARGADLDVLVRGAGDRGRVDWLVKVSPMGSGDPARLREVHTDSNGRARFINLARGHWLVRVESPDALAPGGVVQEQFVQVALDRPNDVVFRVD